MVHVVSNLTFIVPDEDNDYVDTSTPKESNKHRPTHLDPDPYACYPYTQDDYDRIGHIDCWLNGVIGLPLALGGLINNLIFICVLLKYGMTKSLFNQLLFAFSVINMASLIGRIIHIFDRTFQLRTEAYVYLFPQFLYPFRSILLAATVFITIAIVHERWRVISSPNTLTGRHKLAIYIGIVTLLSILINIPRFFEMARVPTILGHHFLRPTSLRTNPYYSIFYICWARLVLLKIIPNVVLIILCYKMYQAVRLGPSETSSGQTSSDFNMDREKRLASIFLAIVVAFFICHLPANFLNIHEAATVNKLIYCLQRHKNGLPPWILCLHDVSSFFLYIYPCINLLFVFVPSFGYRNEYVSLLLCRVWPNRNKTRFDGEAEIEDEADIMDHELSDFGMPGGRRAF